MYLQSDDEDEDEEDPAERRRQEKEAQLKADIENARNLLGASKVDDSEPLSKLANANPSTKEDWEALSKDIYEQLLKQYASRAGFDRYFAPHLILQLSQGMRDVDMRLSGNKLKDLAEKKARAEKEAKKAGGAIKKPKPSNTSTASAKDKIDLGACEYNLLALIRAKIDADPAYSHQMAMRHSTTISILCRLLAVRHVHRAGSINTAFLRMGIC